MITFTDGPARGAALACSRAPMFLRVVIDEDGTIDALDSLDDTPNPSEQIHVYQRMEYRGITFACARGRGRTSSQIVNASYRHLPDVEGEPFRSTSAWRGWAHTEGAQRVSA